MVPGLLERLMFGKISHPGRGPYPPRVALALQPQIWFPTPCGAVSARGTIAFVPGLLEICARISDPGMGPYFTRAMLALQKLGFQHRTGRYRPGRPGDHRFIHRFVRVVDI